MARPRDQIEALNYQRVLAYLMDLVAVPDLEITEDIIRNINAITLDGVPDLGGAPGVYKQCPNFVVNSVTDEVVYRPPTPEATPAMMVEMVKDINWRMAMHQQKPSDVEFHPVITAALACHQINHIHPFVDGNGRTALAVATLILMRHGYMGIYTGDKLRPVKSLEWYLDDHRKEYAESLRYADVDDYRPWMLLFSLAVMETMVRIDEDRLAAMRAHLNELIKGQVAVTHENKTAADD
jgi:Fic family protein